MPLETVKPNSPSWFENREICPGRSNPDGLRRSRFGPVLFQLYRLSRSIGGHPLAIGCRTLRRGILRLILRLEGGDFYSATAREIMSLFHGVEIGAYAYGCFDPDRIPENVSIGRYTSIGPGVRVFVHDHPLDRLSTHPFFYNSALGCLAEDSLPSGRLVIGNDVWVGADVIVVAGCRRIGDGAVVGAGAIVTKDIPDFCIAAGTPAKAIRQRFSHDIADGVMRSEWWKRPVQDLIPHMSAMVRPLTRAGDPHPLFRSWTADRGLIRLGNQEASQ